jgi:ADP-ribose pyrophosphatase YjhB (NUDIX family)
LERLTVFKIPPLCSFSWSIHTSLLSVKPPAWDPRFHTVSLVFTADGKGVLQGGSDAKVAKVFKLEELPEEIAFDHREIITDYISRSAEL